MKRCLVTGAAGFIGSHLSAALNDRGVEVVGVDNFDPFYDEQIKRENVARLDPGRFSLVKGDIRDRALMGDVLGRTRPDVVVHIAALAGVRPSIEDPGRYAEVNLEGFVNVLEAMRDAGTSAIVFASSSSVYGNNAKVPFAEDDPVPKPVSPYAATKRAGEILGETYARVYGIRMGMLRFFTVYGPAQRPDLAIGKFMRLIARGEPVPMFGDGTSSRDYTYIDDIIAGVLASIDRVCAAESGFSRIWNLGNSHPVELSAMIERIGRVVGREPIVKQLPMQIGDVDRTFADVTRSGAELGYAPAVDFDEGLRRQWAWLKPRL